MSTPEYPKTVLVESRICFGIEWFATESEADTAHDLIRGRGDTYNGGFFHGMPCGRDKGHDRDHPELGKIYAVTVA